MQFTAWVLFPAVFVCFSTGFTHLVGPTATGELTDCRRSISTLFHPLFLSIVYKTCGPVRMACSSCETQNAEVCEFNRIIWNAQMEHTRLACQQFMCSMAPRYCGAAILNRLYNEQTGTQRNSVCHCIAVAYGAQLVQKRRQTVNAVEIDSAS